jgi:uncharacterized protein YgbK (DUF1537 family)
MNRPRVMLLRNVFLCDISKLEALLDRYSQINAERNMIIMATLNDAMNQNAQIKSALDELRSSIEKALSDLAATGAAGHAAVLDKIVAGGADVLARVNSLKEEVTTTIAAVPTPSVPPSQ